MTIHMTNHMAMHIKRMSEEPEAIDLYMDAFLEVSSIAISISIYYSTCPVANIVHTSVIIPKTYLICIVMGIAYSYVTLHGCSLYRGVLTT